MNDNQQMPSNNGRNKLDSDNRTSASNFVSLIQSSTMSIIENDSSFEPNMTLQAEVGAKTGMGKYIFILKYLPYQCITYLFSSLQ